jgi:hypothetical protein
MICTTVTRTPAAEPPQSVALGLGGAAAAAVHLRCRRPPSLLPAEAAGGRKLNMHYDFAGAFALSDWQWRLPLRQP